MLSGQLIKDYWNYNVNLVRNAGYALADSVPGQYAYYDFAYGIGEISSKERAEGQASVVVDTWDALADEATYVCSSQNRVQSFIYGANCELPLSFIKPVTGLIETFDAAYEGEDTATQAIENAYSSYDQIMMNAAGFQVDERAYNDGKVPADIAGGIIMGILLDQLTSGMSFFSTSPIDELADGALSTARSELAGSVDELADSTLSTARSELAGSVEGVSQTGTVWDEIIGTADNIPNTEIPATFQIKLNDTVNYLNPQTGTRTLWTNANATEHIAEYICRNGSSIYSVGIRSQVMMESYVASVNGAMSRLATSAANSYDLIYGNWELGINTQTGVVYHARMLE